MFTSGEIVLKTPSNCLPLFPVTLAVQPYIEYFSFKLFILQLNEINTAKDHSMIQIKHMVSVYISRLFIDMTQTNTDVTAVTSAAFEYNNSRF